MLVDMWASLGHRSRGGLIAGAILIVALTAGAAFWVLRTDYQVLFADLKPQDAAMMAGELDRMKVPYRIGGDGTTILVDAGTVHATRLKLMGKDMPLHGAAGFELFNNADFGMTEFAQKINYQRALQGELTRTILSLSEVREARVHLALPEEGLFKRATSKAKAAITLSLKAGQALRPEQVAGIQRLVSAAVPGISAANVTIVDQQGVAITRHAPADDEQDVGTARLDLKHDTERLLARKAMNVLEGAFGPDQAMATVDVTLNMDQVRVTTEEVLGAPNRNGQGASGVIVRERESARDAGTPLGGPAEQARASNSQREVEYQVGRRTEQVATQPGAIRRLQVVAVVRQPMNQEQGERIRLLLGAAVGAVADRGDTIVVQSVKAFDPEPQDAPPPAAMPAAKAEGHGAPLPVDANVTSYIVAGLVLAVAVAVAFAGSTRRRSAARRPLTGEQREAVLAQMREWLEADPATNASTTTRTASPSGAKA